MNNADVRHVMLMAQLELKFTYKGFIKRDFKQRFNVILKIKKICVILL